MVFVGRRYDLFSLCIRVIGIRDAYAAGALGVVSLIHVHMTKSASKQGTLISCSLGCRGSNVASSSRQARVYIYTHIYIIYVYTRVGRRCVHILNDNSDLNSPCYLRTSYSV